MSTHPNLKRARSLWRQQQHERGLVDWKGLDGKRIKVVGPYIATAEREARAMEIIRLRREAARGV